MFLVLSFNVVVEEVGVPCAEALGDCVLAVVPSVEFELVDGEAVPDAESFPLFDLLFESLARESCAFCVSQLIRLQCGGGNSNQAMTAVAQI